jgi:hypothetical protein
MKLPRKLRTASACVAVILPTTLAPAEQPMLSKPPHIQIPHLADAPLLERVLETGEQTGGLRIEGFRQRDLHDGEPATTGTVVYLSYTDRNLYAVFVCSSPGGHPRAHLTPRDDLRGDETVSLLLDTRHDGRHAYEFIANPLGVQMDGMITEGEEEDFDFDTTWRSEGRVTASGYAVLFEIPFKSLRFRSGGREPVGIALARYNPLTNESASWPLLTSRIEAYVPQFAVAEAMPEIQPGHNLQVTPHAFASLQQADVQPGVPRELQSSSTLGLDVKWVMQRGLTFDLAVNPDFSQVESDDPQITTNQRYEVYFPEKRPFFTESSSFFQTPVDLFFSRRIVSPRLGAKLTGKWAGTTLGLLAVDDHAPGLNPDQPAAPASAAAAVMRLQQDLGRESTIGSFISTYSLDHQSFKTISVDTRLKLTPNWVATVQAARLRTHRRDTSEEAGHIFLASLERVGRGFTFGSTYSDVGPRVEPLLGFITRTDLKLIEQRTGYRWHPERGAVQSLGASVYASADWDHAGERQDWQVDLPFSMQLQKATSFAVGRQESMERYVGIPFRKSANYVNFSTEASKWAALDCDFARGRDINYYPAGESAPFLAKSTNASIAATIRPSTRVRIRELYLRDQLQQLPDADRPAHAGTSILRDQILSSRVNVQLSRSLSVRAVIDYETVDANDALVDMKTQRVVRTAAQLTYLLRPGTALFAGYSDGMRSLNPHGTAADRSGIGQYGGKQIYLKLTYSFLP